MLVLTRKVKESIVINENIEVVILGIEGDQVKIGFNAPRNIEILRKEVYEKIKEENVQATNSSIDVLNMFRLKEK